MIYLLNAIGLSPGDSSTAHIYTETIHRTIQNKHYITTQKFWKSAGRAPCTSDYIINIVKIKKYTYIVYCWQKKNTKTLT